MTSYRLKDISSVGNVSMVYVTGDSTQDIQIEIADRPDGKPVVYIRCEGKTIFRLCQAKSVEIIDNRNERSNQ